MHEHVPAYVEENRRKQRLRNRKRHLETAAGIIVEMDALSQIKSDTYIMMRPFTSEKIVEMDALLVELKVLKDFRRNPVASGP